MSQPSSQPGTRMPVGEPPVAVKRGAGGYSQRNEPEPRLAKPARRGVDSHTGYVATVPIRVRLASADVPFRAVAHRWSRRRRRGAGRGDRVLARPQPWPHSPCPGSRPGATDHPEGRPRGRHRRAGFRQPKPRAGGGNPVPHPRGGHGRPGVAGARPRHAEAVCQPLALDRCQCAGGRRHAVRSRPPPGAGRSACGGTHPRAHGDPGRLDRAPVERRDPRVHRPTAEAAATRPACSSTGRRRRAHSPEQERWQHGRSPSGSRPRPAGHCAAPLLCWPSAR